MGIPALSDPRRHCAALDGIRGISALSVLLFHLGRWLNAPHMAVNGGLSVDTFFTLSGYVLARAYALRLRNMSVAEFMAIRLIRLIPIIVLSILISAPYVIARNYLLSTEPQIAAIVLAILLGMMNIPFFNAPPQIGGPQIFPLNGPQFSLFFEIVANYVWWLLRHVDQTYLSLGLYVLCSAAVILVGIGGDTTDNFLLGFAHVGSSFFVGVLIHQFSGAFVSSRANTYIFVALCVLMIAILFSSFELTLRERLVWKLALAPMLVFSGSAIPMKGLPMRISLMLGELSYPVYALHYPIFCWINGIYQKTTGSKSIALECVTLVAVTIAASYVFLRYYDQPARRYLLDIFASLKASRSSRAEYSR
ncbi:acyltransferase family protein [Methylobacterium mesophilicum]